MATVGRIGDQESVLDAFEELDEQTIDRIEEIGDEFLELRLW